MIELVVRNGLVVSESGAETLDVAEIQMTEVVADRLGAECAVFPGGHTAAVEMPRTFAVALRGLLARLRD